MSVVAQSPYTTGNKRLFEEEDTASDVAKRARCSPAGRCRPSSSHPSPSHSFSAGVHPSTVAAVKALFPSMDEQAVESVLAECGQDIDAAIRRLTELKLSNEQAAAAAAGTASQPDTARTACDKQQPQPEASTSAAGASVAGGPQTAEQWVDALVQEMAAAKDFADARGRAGAMLQAFEQFVSARNKEPPGGAGGKLEEVLRENGILKRAVQIQNTKLQEAAAKDQEMAGLKQLLGQYQERMRHLELSNYSLALHLQKATDDRSQPANRPPDVF